jgi:hypothetical protein
MSKVYNMIIFSALLILLLHVAGFHTASSWVISRLNLLNLPDFLASSFVLKLIALFSAVGIAGAVIGSFFSVSPQYIIKSALILPTLILLIGDIISVLTLVSGWVFWVLLLIIAPLAASWAITLIEFWENRD